MIYQLEVIDMSNVNSLVDRCVLTKFIKYFTSIDFAKKYAEKNYGNKITQWHRRNGGVDSGDLGHVMYEIRKIKIEQ